jgi:hypothetical protein
MKHRRRILTFLLLLCNICVFAQLRFGVKGGIGTYDLGVNDAIKIVQGGNEFLLNVQDAKYGYHIGLVLQAKLSSFILQPEIVFNSNSVDYGFGQSNGGSPQPFTEKYQNLDIPILMGLKAGPLRLMAGPVAHYFLSSSSELFEFENYAQKFKELSYGWQAGIGLDFLNLMIDFRYEGNFSKFGSHITFSGAQYSFSNTPARLLASIAVTIK